MLAKRLKVALMIPALAVCTATALMSMGGCSNKLPFEPESAIEFGPDGQSCPPFTIDSSATLFAGGSKDLNLRYLSLGSAVLVPVDAKVDGDRSECTSRICRFSRCPLARVR